MMFSLAVALGCDIFDSASYALFARNGRYMTTQGTAKIEDLEYFPCSCPACHKKTPDEVKKFLLMDRDRFLASHNLYTCMGELQTIKQAIVDGRLWELVETRSRAHPALHTAFKRLLTYAENLEEGTPVRKKKGPFIFTETSLRRPEVLRYQKRLLERYRPPTRATKLILLPESQLEPFREDSNLQTPLRRFERRSDVHICAYGLTFAIVPQELLDVYPLSQTESAISPTNMAINNALKRITEYLKAAAYARCLIFVEEPWQGRIARAIRTKFRRKMKVTIIEAKSYDKQLFSKATKALK